MNYPPIKAKKVTRFFAPYRNGNGNISYKSFGSKMAAAKFLAKQILLDEIFGPKEEMSGGHPATVEWTFWDRPGSHDLDRDAFRKVLAEHFPPDISDSYEFPSCGCPEGDFCGHAFRDELEAIVKRLSLDSLPVAEGDVQ